MKSEMLVRTRMEDPDVLRERRELVQSKSVSELASITSITDFPVPATIGNLLSGKAMSKKADKENEE